MEKPWVNVEIDAGLVRRVESQGRFIPIRSELFASALAPLLKTMLSLELADFDRGMSQLINDIHDVLRKPPLGAPPIAVAARNACYSIAANCVAEIIVRESKSGDKFDPQFSHEDLAKKQVLTVEELADAVHELRNFITDEHSWLWPKEELLGEFDSQFMPRNPGDDALRLATDMLDDEHFPADPPCIAERYGWDARRLNPAINYLSNRNLVRTLKAMNTGG